MSGHSKWSTIKHQKAAVDQARGQVFTRLANIIMIAVREGGGVVDPESNFKLRLAVDKARAANMPKENIQRAIDRAVGKGIEAVELHEVVYEGFAPMGVAIIAEGVTENIQRTSQGVKNVFSVGGGHLGGEGSVAYLFTRLGEIVVAKKNSYDEMFAVALDIGAKDIKENADNFIIYTPTSSLHQVKVDLEKRGAAVVSSELSYIPVSPIPVSDPTDLQKIIHLKKALEILDDIHKVYTNASLT